MIKLREKGFTLVEIMIVVAIIAILSAIAIPNFMAARSKSRANACKANMRQIDSGIEQYAMDSLKTNGDSCAMTYIVPTYIKKTPSCQSGGTYGASAPWCVVSAGPVPNILLDAWNAEVPPFCPNEFEIGSTPWCRIGAGNAAGGYPHILYQ